MLLHGIQAHEALVVIVVVLRVAALRRRGGDFGVLLVELGHRLAAVMASRVRSRLRGNMLNKSWPCDPVAMRRLRCLTAARDLLLRWRGWKVSRYATPAALACYTSRTQISDFAR